MTTFACGCKLEPSTWEDRCEGHRYAACHMLHDSSVRPCPPCQRTRWLSVNVAPSATPTRRGR